MKRLWKIIPWTVACVVCLAIYATAQTVCTENRCYKLMDELGFYIDNSNPLPVETHTFVAANTLCNENRCVKLVDKNGFYIDANNPLPTTGGGGGGGGTVTSVATTSPITGGTCTTSCTIGILASALDQSIYACSDAGSTDDYSCTLPGAPVGYVTGGHYRFKANTANTGAATVNFSALGAKTIKKAPGGVATDLSDNDIRAGQWVDLVYDGTNMQMQSTLGNAGASTLTLQQAYANGKEITGANSFANAALIGDGTNKWAIYTDATLGPLINCVIGGVENACDYYRILASGKVWGIKDASGNIIFNISDTGVIAQKEKAASASPASGFGTWWIDSTDHRFHDKNPSGVIGTTVVADTGASNNFLTAISVAGAISKAQPSFSNISSTLLTTQMVALTGDITNSTGAVATTIANNAVNSTKMAVVNTRRVCDIVIGDTSGSAIANGQLGPQKRLCFVPAAATVVEIDVSADAGTPNVIVAKISGASASDLLSSALATASSGGIACSKTTGVTGIDGVTTCSATLQNTSLAAGDYIQLTSGTAGGTAKLMTIHVIYTIN